MVVPVAAHQVATAEALKAGIEACGDSASIFTSEFDFRSVQSNYDAVCAWGWSRAKRFHERGLKTLLMERAYVADRFEWVSLGWNGLNGRAVWPKSDNGERWNKYFSHLVQPWRRTEGDYALLLGQVPTDTACRDVHLQSWLGNVSSAMSKKGIQVKFRPHPQAPRLCIGPTPVTTGTLHEDLENASFAVTYNSNSSVDAVLYGIPTISYDKGCTAWDVTSHDIEDGLVFPNRSKWAAQLAWKQWLPSELADGTAWRAVREVQL